MKTIQVSVDDLNPAPYNPRQMTEKQYEDLKTSIEKYGLVEPLIVNDNEDRKNVVVGGHQRLNVARNLGYAEVPVVYVDLDEERERELNLRLNKNLGQWDWDKLANEFSEDLLIDVGFSENEIFTEGDFQPQDFEDKHGIDKPALGKCPKCGHEDEREKFIH